MNKLPKEEYWIIRTLNNYDLANHKIVIFIITNYYKYCNSIMNNSNSKNNSRLKH